ncbi:MAG: FAD-dependent oxidoreductase [Candidatus Marinamargulisbacteria bacterium]
MTHILILGGGFAGVGVAQQLQRLITKKNNIKVTMISDNNYVMFQPMLPGVAAGSIEASHIINPIRRLCKNVTFYRARVDQIDLTEKKVKIVENDITRQQWISFDHMVIAMGLATDMSRVPGMTEHSLPMRTLGDAIFLRNEIINKLEMAAAETDAQKKQSLLSFVFIGGGFSGVETMGEVGDMIKAAVKNYPTISKSDIQLTLIHSGDRILKELGEKVAIFAQKKLRARGMTLLLNTRVQEISATHVQLSTGDIIETNTVVCTTGNSPHKVLTHLDFINDRGRLDTDAFFRVVQRSSSGTILKHIPNVWAIGDCACTPNLKEIKHNPHAQCPPTAQFAVRMAPVLAKNIHHCIVNKPLIPFSFKALGQMAVIGHLCGIAEVMGIRFSGVIAFFMWRAIYWVKLPGIYCKFRVLFDWIIHAFFPIDITQLDVYRTEKVDRSHYQKGAYVFREGDIADYFYIIESGHVEIIKENPDTTETLLAVLNAGDSFGEMGLMQKAPRSASVRCVTPVDLLKINRNDFRALTGSYESLRTQLETRVDNIQKNNQKNVGVVRELMDNQPPPTPISDNEPPNPPAFSNTFQTTLQTETEQQLGSIENDLEEKLLNEPRNTDYLRQYAEIQNQLGYIENALTLYYQYLTMVPDDTTVMARIGDMHRRLHQFDPCIEILEKAHTIDPHNAFVIANLASAYRSKKWYQKAEKLLNKGLAINPENQTILRLLAQCHNKQKNAKKGETLIRKHLQHSPNNIHSLMVLAESLILQNQMIDADAFLNKAAQLDHRNQYSSVIQKLKNIIQRHYQQHLIVRQ